MIASIPNIRYYRTFIDFVFHCNWDYRDKGVLDKTHLRFFTRKSIQFLADKVGFRVTDIIYDSKAIQFWGSEQNAKLVNKHTQTAERDQIVFSKKEMRHFKEETKKLNEKNDGDQACFFLYKKNKM